MANAKKNDTPAKQVERKSYRKKPTLKEKKAAAAPQPPAEETMIEAPTALDHFKPRLSGREYARRNHERHLSNPNIISIPANPYKPKGRTKRGWTTPKAAA